MNPGIRYSDRVLIVAPTEGGKSTLANHLLAEFRCQQLVVDTKGHEFEVPGVEPVSDVERIDWAQPVIHFTDRWGELDEFDRLFEVALARRNLVVCVHELADLCQHQPNRTPRFVRAYITKGRAKGLGFLGASQRPVGMPVVARTEIQHVFVMTPGLARDDLAVVAPLMNLAPEQLASELEATHAQLGDHSFIWFARRAGGQLVRCPPLPAHLRERTLVRARPGF